MTEHDPKGEEHVEDLDVPESESEDVKGGISLNFSKIEQVSQKVQKVDIAQKFNPGAKFGDGSV
jgi:hypothetical protein